MLIIRGNRIRLRDWKISEVDSYFKWESDPDVMCLASWRSGSREESARHLEDAVEQSKRIDRQRYFFVTELIESCKVIGSAGFTIKARNQTGGIAEIGYFFHKEYWGMGFATEAAMMQIEYIFRELKLHKVIACCDKRNLASERVMQKCGMIKEGEFKKGRLHQGLWADELQYGILLEQWEIGQKQSMRISIEYSIS